MRGGLALVIKLVKVVKGQQRKVVRLRRGSSGAKVEGIASFNNLHC